MSDNKNRYITTTLPYVNADPHFGHALEFIQTDTLARYWRLLGYEVFFNTGTDEHGQKIAQQADVAKQSRQEYVDHYAARFRELNREIFGLSFDAFIRTTNEGHKAAAQEMWRRCRDNGDIYKKKYTGLYCVGCELFYKDSELLEGNICPIHQKACQEIEEENYFFALSNYQTYLEEYLSQPGVIEPEWRRQEALNFVKAGLEDFSISRERSRMDWGIAVPDDENQVMYVWFDALTNYISTLGWPEDKDGLFDTFWVNGYRIQMAGKDQIRFQSIMWQAMLKSAGVPATEKIFYHGFITSGGHKMSKSLGNVISPFTVVEKYGLEAARYILLRHVHPFDDSDVTWEKMDEWYTANLVNGLGNLVARVMKMAETHLDGPVPRPEVAQFPAQYTEALDDFNFQAACDYVWSQVGVLDERIAVEEPFKLVKTDPEKAKGIIRELVVEIYFIAYLLQPIMPATSDSIKEAVRTNKKPNNLFNRLEI
jgi:methionyl-tRNA synthetase